VEGCPLAGVVCTALAVGFRFRALQCSTNHRSFNRLISGCLAPGRLEDGCSNAMSSYADGMQPPGRIGLLRTPSTRHGIMPRRVDTRRGGVDCGAWWPELQLVNVLTTTSSVSTERNRFLSCERGTLNCSWHTVLARCRSWRASSRSRGASRGVRSMACRRVSTTETLPELNQNEGHPIAHFLCLQAIHCDGIRPCLCI
jgi:hypothetical protein